MMRQFVLMVAVVGILGMSMASGPAWAVNWTGTTGDWGTSGNWDTGEPVAADYAYVGNGGTAVVTLNGEVCTRLNVGWNAGETGNVQIDSGTLNVSSLAWFGYQGAATGVQNGGDATVGRLIVGDKPTATGTYTLNDGTLTVPGVGYSGLIGSTGTGTFVQNGGTATFGQLGSGVGDMLIGYVTSGQGEYRLEGGTATFYDSLVVGDGATGTYQQNGGSTEVYVFTKLGSAAGSHGTFQLDDGSVDLYMNMSVGSGGLGEYIQNGGTNVIHADIWSGYAGSSIELNDGDLSVTEIRLNLISPSGLTFDFNGGTLDVEKMHIELTNDGGTLTPGGSGAIDTTTFMSAGYDYTQSSTGTLQLELASTSSNDLLDVTATGMTAGGTLKVESIGGFVPTVGDTFDIIDGAITGTFDVLDLPGGAGAWDVSALYTDGEITLVPEPNMMILLIVGGLFIIGLRKRLCR